MKRGMSIEYLKCRADLIFEVDFAIVRKINSLRRIRRIRIRIKHLFKRRFLKVNNNISYEAIYRHAIYK